MLPVSHVLITTGQLQIVMTVAMWELVTLYNMQAQQQS